MRYVDRSHKWQYLLERNLNSLQHHLLHGKKYGRIYETFPGSIERQRIGYSTESGMSKWAQCSDGKNNFEPKVKLSSPKAPLFLPF